MQLRQAIRTDLDALVALEHQCFDYSRLGRRSFARALISANARINVVDDGQQLIGYSLVFIRKTSAYWRLYSIATATAARGMGLGTKLLKLTLTQAKAAGAAGVSLEVKVDNQAAIKLYEQFDFAVTDLLSSYYDDGSDGYRMRLTFDLV